MNKEVTKPQQYIYTRYLQLCTDMLSRQSAGKHVNWDPITEWEKEVGLCGLESFVVEPHKMNDMMLSLGLAYFDATADFS